MKLNRLSAPTVLAAALLVPLSVPAAPDLPPG